MKITTNEQILVSFCTVAGQNGLSMTKTEVWTKLRTVTSRTKKAAAVEIGEMFGFSADQIETVQRGL